MSGHVVLTSLADFGVEDAVPSFQIGILSHGGRFLVCFFLFLVIGWEFI